MQKSVKLVVCGGPAASMGTSCHSRPEEVGFEVEGQDDVEVGAQKIDPFSDIRCARSATTKCPTRSAQWTSISRII
jgi:hypothetical protein